MLPSSGFRIGRVFGIDIVINYTWLFIFFLVGISFASVFRAPELVFGFLFEYLRRHPFPQGPWPWIAGFATAVLFFACLLAHELSHSYVAKRSGVGINRITLFLFGGVAEMSEDVRSAGVEFWMAIAGPLASFVMAGIFFLLYLAGIHLETTSLLVVPLLYLATINLAVGVFNLLPGFPLDGGRILRAVLWKVTGNIKKATRIASVSGQVLAVLIAGAGVYSFVVGSYVGGFWFVLIGMFLYRLAQNSYRQTLFRLATADTRVSDIMYTDIPLIDPETTLTVLRASYFAPYKLPAFPVVSGGVATGMVLRQDLASVSLAEWDLLNAGRIARPLDSVSVVPPDTPLDKVMKQMLRGEEFILVMYDLHVLGMVTREELLRYVETRLDSRKGA